eukprot:m.125193 g.125193  ORF g.125193 m.125193 type:complete len:273 (+) comp23452_c0_seq4:316-1134(+)
MQCFQFTLTVAVCEMDAKTGKLKILRTRSEQVYPSPSHRRMDVKKGSEDVITYPLIFFNIDNFDFVFEEVIVGVGENVCLELVGKFAQLEFTMFSGSVSHSALAASYQGRKTGKSWTSLRTSRKKKVEFLEMRGPMGLGRAQMAVSIYEDFDAIPVDQPSPSSSGIRDYLARTVSIRRFASSFYRSSASSSSDSASNKPVAGSSNHPPSGPDPTPKIPAKTSINTGRAGKAPLTSSVSVNYFSSPPPPASITSSPTKAANSNNNQNNNHISS